MISWANYSIFFSFSEKRAIKLNLKRGTRIKFLKRSQSYSITRNICQKLQYRRAFWMSKSFLFFFGILFKLSILKKAQNSIFCSYCSLFQNFLSYKQLEINKFFAILTSSCTFEPSRLPAKEKESWLLPQQVWQSLNQPSVDRVKKWARKLRFQYFGCQSQRQLQWHLGMAA